MSYFGSANIVALFYFAKPFLIKTELFSYRLIFSTFKGWQTASFPLLGYFTP
jgi:hypothetical protein